MSKPRQERRRGQRVFLSFHVEVSGIGPNGVPYCDQASASDISDRGCQLHLSREVKPGDLLSIRVIRAKSSGHDSESPFLYQTVWVERNNAGWVAGLSALEAGYPWPLNFPQESLVRS